ncbi:MAG: DUF308 domain-containing protein [Gammaproteobacteria bacterium]
MSFLLPFNDQDVLAFHKNSRWFLVWGAIMFILGALALSFTTFTTLFTIVLLGMLFMTVGVVILVDTFSFWLHKSTGFLIHFLMGLLYLALGFMFVKGPVWGSISLTLLLGVFYIVIGFFRIIFSLTLRAPKWGWNFLNGAVALLLGVLIMVQWPASSLFIIGLFVGIDLLIYGWAYMMAALAAGEMPKTKET